MKNKLFNENLITLNADANSWQEAIKISCEKLIKYKYIKKSYEVSIFESIKKMGPYFILLDNFAMPHTNDFNSVYKSGISFTTLKKPVRFENGKNVQVLCTLAAKDATEHLGLLQKLAKLLQNPDIIERLIKVKTYNELVKMEEKL